jgi:hypothetical protein
MELQQAFQKDLPKTALLHPKSKDRQQALVLVLPIAM